MNTVLLRLDHTVQQEKLIAPAAAAQEGGVTDRTKLERLCKLLSVGRRDRAFTVRSGHPLFTPAFLPCGWVTVAVLRTGEALNGKDLKEAAVGLLCAGGGGCRAGAGLICHPEGVAEPLAFHGPRKTQARESTMRSDRPLFLHCR